MGNQFRREGDRFIKWGVPARIQREARRTRRAAQLRHFRTPTVLDCEGDTMVLAWIHGLQGFMEGVANSHAAPERGYATGRALAEIHQHFEPPYPRSAPPGTQPLHGDFCTMNLFWEGDTLVVLDWDTPNWLGPTPSYGDPAFDMALLWMSIACQPMGGRHRFAHTPKLLMHILDGYRAHGGSMPGQRLGEKIRSMLPRYARMRRQHAALVKGRRDPRTELRLAPAFRSLRRFSHRLDQPQGSL